MTTIEFRCLVLRRISWFLCIDFLNTPNKKKSHADLDYENFYWNAVPTTAMMFSDVRTVLLPYDTVFLSYKLFLQDRVRFFKVGHATFISLV